MPTIKLIPSTYYLSNSSYLSVSNAANMYTDTDSDTYATVTNSRSSTSNYYIYVRGFNFEDIPSAAVVSDFTVRLKARESGVAQSSSYNPYLADGTSAINGSCSYPTTTATVREFTGISADWETLKGYGSDLGIRINCRRASRNTTSYMYIYGAEIEVTYTVPNPRTITTTLSGNGTIVPSGATTTYDGEEFELVITPTNKSDTVTAKRDGVDITAQLVAHGAGSTNSYAPDDHTTHSIQSGSSYASYCIGHTAESPSSSGTSSNMYASSGSTGYAAYTFDFSNIPSSAVIEEVAVRCYGHRENATIDSSHVSQVVLYAGSTQKGTEEDFPSTSNSLLTVEDTGTWTRSELDELEVRHYVGYYGGLVLGITVEITYSTGSGVDHYTYTYTVSGNSTIAVVIGSAETDTLYVQLNSAVTEVAEAWKKLNGSWVVQSDLTTVFSSGVNYKKG